MSKTLPRLDAITGYAAGRTSLFGWALNECSSSALLIGTWASSLVYTAELLQAWYYFENFKDSWKLKSYVAVTLVIDTISAVGDYACVYLYTITHAGAPAALLKYFFIQFTRPKGDLVYLTKQNWPVPLYVISTTTVAFLVQSFLAFRYWRFTKNAIIVCCLSILILAAFSAGVSTGLIVVLFPAFKDRNKIRISATVWIIIQVSADLIIAGALVREFMKAKSLFKGQQRRVNNVLNRLVLHTIQTGTATAVIAVLALVVFLIDDQSNVPVGIMYPLGRVYVLSMLINLNIRDSENSILNGGRQRALAFAHSTAYNISSVRKYVIQSVPAILKRQFLKSSVIPVSHMAPTGEQSRFPTLQTTANISETQSPEIEMVPVDVKRSQRSDTTCI
ncbi:hypothetical protein MSAN_01818600 [Mycena sanguinolenta]|uniref:DUF6534 domain-containing protein n=1 Tax=Mycena sanguinolenta TaxID=230812 RepID=A0A8H6XRP1_9AGAR|nr:hypothetical protein MSAN_01818600 [Mycena sanguinolenta]